MCGIVGYTGPRDAAPILLDGLARLEYRGYDSAGIALVTADGELFVEKRAGKLANLRTALAGRDAARRGRPRATPAGRRTAAPTTSTRTRTSTARATITVIHNGIIENFQELRDGLAARGHRFESETDTEVARAPRRGGLRRATSRRPCARRCARRTGRTRSRCSTAASRAGWSGARRNVPLIVGVGDGENFLASDVAAVLAHTREVIFLEEGDVADLDAGVGRHHGPRRRPPWTARRITSTGPWRPPRRAATSTSCSRRCTSSRWRCARRSRAASHGDELRVDGARAACSTRIARADRIELVACGTAGYAAAVGAHALQAWTGLPARWNIGSEFRYSPPPLDERTLVIAVTQSGETADTLAPDAPGAGARLPGHRGHQHRRLGHHARRGRGAVPPGRPGDRGRGDQDVRDPGDHAGDARGGHREGARRAWTRRSSTSSWRRSGRCPTRRSGRWSSAAPARELARRYVDARGFMFVGRGITYPVALEGALKLKEVSYVHAEGYAAGELKHGPISLLDAEVPLVAIATRSVLQREAHQQRDGGPRAGRARARGRDRGRRARCASSRTTSCGCPTRSRC